MMRALTILLAVLPAVARGQGAAPSKDATRFGSPPSLPAGASRETMWPAPTADDWKMPCLITWQRTFEDALKVARATKKPILVCVNMDGEIASEHFAGIRYRRAETARLYDPYVCVIASVYRHTPRDYDEEGNRIVCPRFGTVTCGEHIAIEPGLYDEFFDGKRIAPRHIEIEVDRKKSYDVYFSWDTNTVATALREGVANRPPPEPMVKDDLPVVERVASPDVADRVAVETAYKQGNREVRRTLIESTLRHKDVDEIDLLRLAIFGFDVELARLARQALARSDSEAAVDLIAEALKLPMDPAEREALIAAVVRLGEKYPRARTLAAVYQGLADTSKLVDLRGWSSAMEHRGETPAQQAYEQAPRLESRVEASEARPSDATARLELAESFLARASEAAGDRRFARVLLEDARSSAVEAEKLGAKGWRVDAALAVSASALGDRNEALTRAQAAVEGGMPPPSGNVEAAPEQNAVLVLALFAQARQRAIAKAYHDKSPWPPEWLADVHAAYAVLAKHPLGTDEHVANHFDFLRWLGATPRATEVLEQGLARFPESWLLHDRLRAKTLWEKGPDGLEATYAAMLAKKDPPRNLEWFAGFASLIAAENHRRAGNAEKAKGAYERAIAHYDRNVAQYPESRDTSDHYVALALAGRARVEFEQGDLDQATSDVLAAFRRRPASAASLDGLNLSPVDTAKMLRSKLAEAKRTNLAKELQAGLDALDPKALELPAYEREVPESRPR